MTERKHLKARVRARMAHTGERYAAARAHVVPSGPASGRRAGDGASSVAPSSGTNPAANALRLLLAHVGLEVDEPLALTIGGGPGFGVFQFHYAKEGFSSLFLAGRHAWDDDLRFMQGALRRLGLEAVVTETGSARTADRQLREALTEGRPVVAWVDAAELETRGYPPEFKGGAYHVVVVRSLDDTRNVAIIDDLARAEVEVPIETLARARARIGKFRHRLLRLPADAIPPDTGRLVDAIQAGVDATVDGFDRPRNRNFSLDALLDWSARLRGSGKDAWSTVFPPGARLWSGLAAIHEYVEHYGSGGGLLRPMVAAGLREAAGRVGGPRLADVAARYEDLGSRWTALAHAALPDDIGVLRRTRELQDRRARLYADRGADAAADLAASWAETARIRAAMAAAFPLDDRATRTLLDHLAMLVDELHGTEVETLDALRATP
jgi:hypothetical protein